MGLAHATYSSRLVEIVLSWQGALALGLTFAWSLADLILRRRQRPPFADAPTARRALTLRALSAAVTLIIVGVDLALLVSAGLAIKTALLLGGAFFLVWIGLAIVVIIVVTLRRRLRGAAEPHE